MIVIMDCHTAPPAAVFVNGEELANCFLADDENGVAYSWDLGPDGEHIRFHRGTVSIETRPDHA